MRMMAEVEQEAKMKKLAIKDAEKRFLHVCKNGDFEELCAVLALDVKVSGETYKKGTKIAARNGHIPICKYLIKKCDKFMHCVPSYLEDVMIKIACHSKQFKLLEFLFNLDPKNELRKKIKMSDVAELACTHGHIDILKYLVETGGMEWIPPHKCFSDAVSKDQLGVIQYLITLPEIQKGMYYGITWLSEIHTKEISLEIIKLFLKEDGNKPAYIHHNKDRYFKELCVKYSQLPSFKNEFNKSIIEFLIFEYKLEKTNSISNVIKDYPYIAKMFMVRELNEKLNQDLIPTQTQTKLKI